MDDYLRDWLLNANNDQKLLDCLLPKAIPQPELMLLPRKYSVEFNVRTYSLALITEIWWIFAVGLTVGVDSPSAKAINPASWFIVLRRCQFQLDYRDRLRSRWQHQNSLFSTERWWAAMKTILSFRQRVDSASAETINDNRNFIMVPRCCRLRQNIVQQYYCYWCEYISVNSELAQHESIEADSGRQVSMSSLSR